MVARLHPMKGHVSLLRAAARLSAHRTELRIVMVGEGPDAFRDRLVGIAEDLSLAQRVLWVSRGEDLASAYSAFDVTCVGSLYGEGLPNAALESLACGTPCVVTDVGDAAILCEAFPGRVVAPGDPDATSAALDEALRSPASEAISLRDTVRRRFALGTMIDETESLLQEISPSVAEG
jgi:glycosyltransferase involved in cell wall biosynthesis